MFHRALFMRQLSEKMIKEWINQPLPEVFYPREPDLAKYLDIGVKRINETTGHRIFISGSSSKLSSAELPTQLRGRSLEVRVTPLTFLEFLNFKKAPAALLTDADKKRLLREYLTYGGLPEIVLAQEGVKYLIVDEYYKTFVQRDVLDRYKIRNDQGLRDLMLVLLNSNYYTLNSLSN